MSNHNGSKVRNTEGHIQKAVQLREQGMGYRKIAKELGVSLGTAHGWVNKCAPTLVNDSMKAKPKNISDTKHGKRVVGAIAPEVIPTDNGGQEETLEQKVARLERELKDATLMRDFYNEMINVAEKQFNIPIRKKAGTRR